MQIRTQFIFLSFILVASSNILASFPKPAPPVVRVQRLSLESVQDYRSTVGTLRSKYQTQLKTESLGRVQAIWAQSGQTVHAHQLILELNHDIETADLKQAQIQRDYSKWLLKRTQNLYEKKAVSTQNLKQTKQNYLIAQANCIKLQARLNKKMIYAPFSGQLGVVQARLGQYLQPGSAVAYLSNTDTLWVDFSIPQNYFSYIKPRGTVFISSASQHLTTTPAQIIAHDPVVDENTRQLALRAHLKHPASAHINVGSSVKVLIPYGAREQRITLPESAIELSSGGTSVFVLTSSNQVQKRKVNLGFTRPDGSVIIQKGLKPGETVVILGGLKLYDGQTVSPKVMPGQ